MTLGVAHFDLCHRMADSITLRWDMQAGGHEPMRATGTNGNVKDAKPYGRRGGHHYKGHIRAPHNLCHPISCKLGKWLMTVPSTCVGSYRLLVAAVFPDSSGEANHSLMSVICILHAQCSDSCEKRSLFGYLCPLLSASQLGWSVSCVTA